MSHVGGKSNLSLNRLESFNEEYIWGIEAYVQSITN